MTAVLVDSSMSWVFGYGSLVSPTSLERTLGRPVPTDRDWVLAVLRGYGRRWNYGSRTVRADWEIDGRPVERGLIVALGLVEAPGDWCNGAVAAVSDDELALLDRRERDYDRVDVTDRIDPAGTISGPVVTYVPRTRAVARYVEHRDEGRAAVSRRYFDLVRTAFDDLGPGEAERFEASTPAPAVPVIDLEAFGNDTSPSHWRTDR